MLGFNVRAPKSTNFGRTISATMAHRDSTFGNDGGGLGHIGLEGVSHTGFMLAMIFPDIRSFFYSVHFWIYRGAKFPIKKWKLWARA